MVPHGLALVRSPAEPLFASSETSLIDAPLEVVGAIVTEPEHVSLLVVHAEQAAGASRAGILFGMAPLFSALIAILAFSEPLRWPLAAGTLLVVVGGVALAWEAERPVDYRAYGASLAVTVAVAFGLRDNAARAVSEEIAAGRARAGDGNHAWGVARPAGEPPSTAVGATAPARGASAVRSAWTKSSIWTMRSSLIRL